MRVWKNRRLIFGIIFGGVLAGSAMILDRSLPPTDLSLSDLHLLWLIAGREYFVDAGGGLLISNPELVRLTNPRQRFFGAKQPGVFRIFCIGGSTTQGWPFNPRLSYPRLLSLILRDALPGRRIEVINAGLEGSDSWSDIRLTEEIAIFKPDLLIIHEGRNEAWNLPLHAGWRATFLRVHAWLLRHVRLYGRLRQRIVKPENNDAHANAIRRWCDLSRRNIQPGRKYLFHRNMESILARAGCPVVLLSQVVSPEEDKDDPAIIEINDWIRELAKDRNVALIDIDAEFRRRWNEADRLIIPFPVAHPDLEGYELMARLVAHGLAARSWPVPSKQWRWDKVRADAVYERLLGVNESYLAEIYIRLAKLFTATGMPQVARLYGAKSRQFIKKR